MKYQEFVETIAERTRWPQEAVKEILDEVPEVLTSMRLGERTWTPLGNFTMRHQKSRSITVNRAKTDESTIKREGLDKVNESMEGDRLVATVPEKAIVRLRPNQRMTVLPDDVQWRHVMSPPPKNVPK